MSGRSNRGCLGCVTVVVAIVVAALLVVFVWIPSQRKSYTIDDVRILATVLSDGTLTADERFTYTFHGDFTRVYRDIPYSPVAPIVVTGVTGPDGPLKRLPTGWTPASGRAARDDPGVDDATPSPWSSIPPEQRPAGYYRVTTDWATSAALPSASRPSPPSATARPPFTFHWRAADAAERCADTGELTWQLDRPRLGRAHGARARRRRPAGRREGRRGPGVGTRPAERGGARARGRLGRPLGRRSAAGDLRRGPPALPAQAARGRAELTDIEVLPSRLAAEAELARRPTSSARARAPRSRPSAAATSSPGRSPASATGGGPRRLVRPLLRRRARVPAASPA